MKIPKQLYQEIKYKNIVIRLYQYKTEDSKKEESNIEAFDKNNNQLWRAENCPQGRYYEMQIDEDNNQLQANDGGGMYYTIELDQGKIISSQLIK
jgi:hypothetical protein